MASAENSATTAPDEGEKTSPRRGRRRATTVPVASREAANKAKKPARKRLESLRGDIVGVAILIGVVLVVLIAIAVPMRNYYEGKAEIARLHDSIAAKEQRKADLEAELELYNDPAYAKQEARRRLGMIEEGETAWRIMDPRMEGMEQLTSEHKLEPQSPKPWGEVMWDSLKENPK
ncbi:FtsB family cell division protein [Corynebacterium aquatimens]|uniref:Cell division protein FtsB n=1 Tax=Corynebacterium aquatimens TaxID=1190508 RepID=A0A931GW34_9CORY|nr:septum formation initiator family protein [Corynebacterium aquatimens]MBG6122056.1 cell division protein FtsB [Corynebacterium aquatimens]WJY65403.1 Cell division protein FtsB [Corynebacterium aquatimens]